MAEEAGAPNQSCRRLQRRDRKPHHHGGERWPTVPGGVFPADVSEARQEEEAEKRLIEEESIDRSNRSGFGNPNLRKGKGKE